jgi:peroxiredoxin
LPVRLGAILVTPVRALAAIDRRGGGFRDALWLVLAGMVCFRLEALARGVLGVSHLSLGTVVRQTLAVASSEVTLAAAVVVPAAVILTLLAGRGRRDPSRDLELGAACYVPFFAGRALFRALDLRAFGGPLPAAADLGFLVAATLWAGVTLAIALWVARRRGSQAEVAAPARGRSLGAAGLLGAALAVVLAVNGRWVLANAAAIRPLSSGQGAPGFSLPRVNGSGSLALEELRGKVVLLDFWATWCPPCVQMLPTLHDVHERWHGQGFELVGVNADGGGATREDIATFLGARPAPYPVVFDEDGEVAKAYRVLALPHMVLLGRDGAVRKTFWGVTSRSELEGAIEDALR